MHRDKNSIIYAVLSQLNPKRWGGETLAHTYDVYNLLNNYNLQGYLEQFRVDDRNSRGAYNVDNGLYIGRGGFGPIATKFGKLIICIETGTVIVTKLKQRRLTRRVTLFFPNMNHNFYVIEKTFRFSLDKFHRYINDPVANSGKINVHKLLPVSTCIEYYSNFGNNDPPITEHTTIESLLTFFLNNVDNIALIINLYEVTSLMFKENRNPGYEDAELDYQTNMNFTPHTVQLSISIEKEKQDPQKQIDNYNLLTADNMSFIKDKQKELAKNRKEVKQLTRKLDEYIQKNPFILMNNSSSTSPSSFYSVIYSGICLSVQFCGNSSGFNTE
jgi:hypothetical protein